jgi:hypothetical protein
MNVIFNHICNYCNKPYKSRQSLWNHINKFHYTEKHKNDGKVYNQPQKTTENDLTCEYCKKKFSRNDSLIRHSRTCKIKLSNINSKDEIINLLKQTIDEQKKMFENQIIEMKKQLIETMNKNCKVHPKTLQKINKQLINNNKNINNGIVNNTYNIIGLGHENLHEVFSRKEKMAILKNRFYCLPELVEYTHFNDKYPQFKNILITNTQNTLAYKYDTKKKQFMAINKDELLEDIVDARICDISSFYEELENDLDSKTKEIIEKVIDKIENDPAYKEIKKKDIKLIIYNNRKKVIKDNLLEDEFDV